jgi:uncharacterized membrane protein
MNGKTALGLDNNVGALLCYVNVCLPIGLVYSIIVLVTDKTNKLPRFHAVQSLMLLVAAIAIMIPLYIIMIVGVFIDAGIGLPIISGISGLILSAFGLAVLVFVVLSAIKAYGGELYKIPVIGNLADKYSN